MLRQLLLASFTALLLIHPAQAAPDPADWDGVRQQARGQTVYWHAWGGDQRINAYIAWAGAEARSRYGVRVEHVKLTATSEAVSRVLAERAAGRHQGGAVDLIWLNGENFAAMKAADLLFGPWAEDVPNWRYVDVEGKPTVIRDFTIPTDGLEAPWSMAQVVFYHETARLPDPPRTLRAMAAWIHENPGRFSFPQPPNFLGTTFLKQALLELVDDPAPLYVPVDEAYSEITAPLWAFLEDITPRLWRSGRAYPRTGPQQRQMMADGEIDLAISFSPGEASAAIANFELPDTVRTFVLDGGTIGNTNFVAIPYNARAKAGAMVLANFLMSPEAQAHKQDPEVWGDLTVLDLDALGPEDRIRFDRLSLGVATLPPEALGQVLEEPHPSWMVRIEQDWQARFGTQR